MAGPLSKLRILDLSRIVAGPWASQIFADLGADVIKIERPLVGDDTRSWGPPFLHDRNGNPTDIAGYFLSLNRGKRSVTVDLSTLEGQGIIRSLAERCDVVLENYKPGTLTRFGLGEQDLRRLNPKLIYLSISGFGQTGPRREQPAYDFMVQALGGLMSVTGEADRMPQKVGVPIVDIMTGMYAVVAILAAVEKRHETGRGDYIDLAMLDVQSAFLSNQAMNYLLTAKAPGGNGNKHPNIAPQDAYACRDGSIALACGNDGQFRKLVEVLGEASLSTDERFVSNTSRVKNYSQLRAILENLFATRELLECIALLNAAGIPCGPINNIAQALSDEQTIHREMVRQLPHPLSGTVPQVVSPLRFADNPLSFATPPPLLGEHTSAVLRELGIEEDHQLALRDKGAV